MKHRNAAPIQRHVNPGFEAVRAAFAENLCRRRELGGTCCVFATGGRELKLYSIIPDQAVARQGRAADSPARQRLPTPASLRERPCF